MLCGVCGVCVGTVEVCGGVVEVRGRVVEVCVKLVEVCKSADPTYPIPLPHTHTHLPIGGGLELTNHLCQLRMCSTRVYNSRQPCGCVCIALHLPCCSCLCKFFLEAIGKAQGGWALLLGGMLLGNDS